MERYANTDGDSSIASYECGPDSIAVEFVDGRVYVWTHASCGVANCEQMKRLAVEGNGLNSFIMRHVRMSYASRT